MKAATEAEYAELVRKGLIAPAKRESFTELAARSRKAVGMEPYSAPDPLPYPLTVICWGLVTKSEMNTRSHWAERHRRFKNQKELVLASFMGVVQQMKAIGHYVRSGGKIDIRMTRMASRKLDSDNEASSLKAVRDAVAELLGIDDGNPLVTWITTGAQGLGVAIDISKGDQ